MKEYIKELYKKDLNDLDRSHLFIFLIFITLGGDSKRTVAIYIKECSSIFSFKTGFYKFVPVLVLESFFLTLGFPGGSDGKESVCNAGAPDSIPGSGRSPGEGNGYPLQYSCLENPMDRGA